MGLTRLGDLKVTTSGELPALGDPAPGFLLTSAELRPTSLEHFRGKRLVLNIFPSLDTGVCAASVRKFNKRAGGVANTTILCISKDLPFAQTRFCSIEGITNIIFLSDFRTGSFGRDYGVELSDGPFGGLLARAVVVSDAFGKVIYRQLVPSIDEEPDYDAVFRALQQDHNG